MAQFSERLRHLRSEKGITQKALADQLGISKSSVNMYERGEREPSLETMEAIADYFNVDMDYLYGKTVVKRWFQHIDGGFYTSDYLLSALGLSNDDLIMIASYHSAPNAIRSAIDGLLNPYKTEDQYKEEEQ